MLRPAGWPTAQALPGRGLTPRAALSGRARRRAGRARRGLPNRDRQGGASIVSQVVAGYGTVGHRLVAALNARDARSAASP